MFDLITAFTIFALVLGGRAVLASQRSPGLSRGQKIASFLALILYLCGVSLFMWALIWRGLICLKNEPLGPILAQIKELHASLGSMPQKALDGRKPAESFGDKQ
ncbi:autophagy protein Atg13 [Aspergillus luchuensis]|uniref:Autophagy protein Atg13 n=1 Tax=Aspergillus kawachii TaxID=1069201 RepID=A0A146F961_ASPKA|nr:autophagy protein Atg13 [Aspergillus luchuensis]